MRKQNRTLWVFKYLWEQTDDEHPATIADITAYLESQGQSVKDYRVIQADIAELASMGIDIVENRSRHYAASHNIREQAGLNDGLALLALSLGIDVELQGSSENAISIFEDEGTDYLNIS